MLQKLVRAKLDTYTAAFSDDFDAQKRDDETYASLLASQSEYTDELISVMASEVWNGGMKIEDL